MTGLSFEEVKRIKKEFQEKYFFKEPFSFSTCEHVRYLQGRD